MKREEQSTETMEVKRILQPEMQTECQTTQEVSSPKFWTFKLHLFFIYFPGERYIHRYSVDKYDIETKISKVKICRGCASFLYIFWWNYYFWNENLT